MGRTNAAEAADHEALEHARALLHYGPRRVTIPETALVSGQTERRLYARFRSNQGMLSRLVDHEIMGIMSSSTVNVTFALAPETHHLSRAWAVRMSSLDQRRAIVAAFLGQGINHVTAWALLSAGDLACEERLSLWDLRMAIRGIIDRLATLQIRSREETNPGFYPKR